MAINSDSPNLGVITEALTTTGTSELRFRNAVIDVATQVDANQIDINLDRPITLDGPVTGSGTFNIGTGEDNSPRTIEITTEIGDMTLDGVKILPGTITNAQVAPGTLTFENVRGTNTLMVEIYGPTVGEPAIFEGYLLVPTPNTP